MLLTSENQTLIWCCTT